jgi:hypothetical protein
MLSFEMISNPKSSHGWSCAGPIPDVDVVISVLLQAEIPLPVESSLQQPQQSQRTQSAGNAGSIVNQADSASSVRPQPGSNGSTRSGNQQQATSGEDRRSGGSGRSRQHQQQKRKEPDSKSLSL